MYAAEGNDAQTYLLLYRRAKLILENLSKHSERTLPENKAALKAANLAVQHDLLKLEEIRPRIAKRHDEYLERRKAQQKALEALEGRGADEHELAQELDGLALNQGQRKRQSYEKASLDAGTNRSLAAKLALREVRRRDAARRSVRQAGISEEQEQERRTGGMWGDWEKDLRRESDEMDNDLSRQIQEVARIQNGQQAPNFSVCYLPYLFGLLLTYIASYLYPNTIIPLPFRPTREYTGEMVRLRLKTATSGYNARSCETT